MLFGFLSSHQELGVPIIRISFGALLMTHGYPKLTSGFRGTMQWLASKGLPSILGPLVGILELVGGAFLVVGLMTPVVAALFALQFLGIVLNRERLGKAKLSDYEKDLLYLGGALAVLFLGGGIYSLDHVLGL